MLFGQCLNSHSLKKGIPGEENSHTSSEEDGEQGEESRVSRNRVTHQAIVDLSAYF